MNTTLLVILIVGGWFAVQSGLLLKLILRLVSTFVDKNPSQYERLVNLCFEEIPAQDESNLRK